MHGLRHRISGFLTISVVAAVAATTLGISPAQAHLTTPVLFPTANGTYTGWSADVTAVDINLAGDRLGTSGCDTDDYAGFPVGDIALIQPPWSSWLSLVVADGHILAA